MRHAAVEVHHVRPRHPRTQRVGRDRELRFGESDWSLSRADPDFHQRLTSRVEESRMVGQADTSEDEGKTWRKDLDLVFERAPRTPAAA